MLDTLDVYVHDGGTAPTRSHDTDGGLDLYTSHDPHTVRRGGVTYVNLGVSAAIPPGYVGLLVERSSTHKWGVGLANKVGVIDPDYRGVIAAAMVVTGPRDMVVIPPSTKLVQLLLVPVATPAVNIVNSNLETTERGAGGFGSTNS